MANRTVGADTSFGTICSLPFGGGSLISFQSAGLGKVIMVGVGMGVGSTYPGGGPGLLSPGVVNVIVSVGV